MGHKPDNLILCVLILLTLKDVFPVTVGTVVDVSGTVVDEVKREMTEMNAIFVVKCFML